MSESFIMNRYMRAQEEDAFEPVEIDDDIQPSSTIRVESGQFFYDVEYDPVSQKYLIVATNNPAIYQSQ